MAEWEAFHYFEPWGTPATDDRWSILYTLTHRAHFQHNNEDIPWLDRDPQETARLREIAEAAVSLEDKFDAFFAPIAVSEEPPSA